MSGPARGWSVRSTTCSTTRSSGARRAASIEIRLVGGTLTVRDHGPGIAEADLPHVFDRFYRAAAARALPGSGLGLAIVKQTVDDHGGSLAAANADGGGTLLTLRFDADGR